MEERATAFQAYVPLERMEALKLVKYFSLVRLSLTIDLTTVNISMNISIGSIQEMNLLLILVTDGAGFSFISFWMVFADQLHFLIMSRDLSDKSGVERLNVTMKMVGK